VCNYPRIIKVSESIFMEIDSLKTQSKIFGILVVIAEFRNEEKNNFGEAVRAGNL
jgi:hypothetical protein